MRRERAERTRRNAAPRRSPARAVAVGLILLLAACASPAADYVLPEPVPNRYDYLDAPALAELRTALLEFDEGDDEAALSKLDALALDWPSNVAVGAWRQEVELVLAAERARRDGLSVEASADLLRASYRATAEEQPSPTALVLAARLEPDPPAARLLLQRAAELDPSCAPAHHGLAHVVLREGDYDAARDAIARALAADPTHLPSVRLQGWMLLQAGRREEAVSVMRAFLTASAGDPRIPARVRAATQLDVAIALLADGHAEEAALELDAVDARLVEADRRLTTRVVVETNLGRAEDARATARAAQMHDPGALLPVVQEALLLEQYLDDPYEARRAWERVLERSPDAELGDVFQRLRAEVHRLRLEQAVTTWKDAQ